MRHFLKYDLIPILSMIAVCAFPCAFMYARNAGEASPSEMIPFLLVFFGSAAIMFLLTLPFFRNVSRAAFWTDLGMLVIINFSLVADFVKDHVSFLRERYFLLLILALLAALFLLLLRKKPDLRTGCLLLLLGFGAMILINGALAVPAEIRKAQFRDQLSENKAPPEFDLSGVKFRSQDRPNVYWFMFDEYGGYENLRHYYDYDNAEFLETLEDRGFDVSWTSRNTEGIFTNTIMTNLLNLNYLVVEDDESEKKKMHRDNGQIYQMFAANGYNINLVNHTDYLADRGCRVLTSNQSGRSISEFLLRNSIYYKIERARFLISYFFIAEYGAGYRIGLDNAMEAGLACWQAATEDDGPTLTLGYYQFPHSPTMVGPNGEALPFSAGWNWTDHSLYLGQVEYCNKFILNLVTEIQTHDPDALIMLCSDHGNRYALHMLQCKVIEKYDPYEENQYMQNILNCVYYKGETFDIEGQTGINTMRRVFNQVFDAGLPDVEPYYSYIYEYEDEAF